MRSLGQVPTLPPCPKSGVHLSLRRRREGRACVRCATARQGFGDGPDTGTEDTDSVSVRAWAPAYENHTFSSLPEGTKLIVDQDVTEDFEQYMQDMWPKALELLKQHCEDKGTD